MGEPTLDLVLLGRFDLLADDRPVWLPKGAQRLLAFLGVRDGTPAHRSAVAEQLWPENTRQRASANLRQALWQARRSTDVTVVQAAADHLRLTPALTVDFGRALACAHHVVGAAGQSGAGIDEWLTTALAKDLLPDWGEQWLVAERHHWEQVRLHTLETIAERLTSAGAHLAALEAAFAAIAIDPVRESAHRAVIAVHLAQGNAGSALRHYQHYRGLLHRELGVLPSPNMTRLVSALPTL